MTSSASPAVAKPRFRGAETLGKSPQQSILNVLRMACAEALRQPDFAEKLQTIKQRFYVRDFNGIFLDPPSLPVYTAQYVPRRALCYYEIFSCPEIQEILRSRPTIYCLGAGSGSELVGFSAASCTALAEPAASGCAGQPIVVHSQDYTDWSAILGELERAVRYKWGISKSQVEYEFSKGDLLSITPDIESRVSSAQLVTAMFVFNELFSDKANAMNFVKTIVKCTTPGSYFLLVDSAGSFSSVQVAGKNYMSYMFFDSLRQFFTPVISEDSKWFRHAHGLDYPLAIENMRYFIRLYRRN
ncbi:hypothetical protein GQ54DRAFT_258042 [Martensiomyces pterosporus]|nr:hypothetical protein GQ54DRAFT_258042 [Martensiomyces pterosporus]